MESSFKEKLRSLIETQKYTTAYIGPKDILKNYLGLGLTLEEALNSIAKLWRKEFNEDFISIIIEYKMKVVCVVPISSYFKEAKYSATKAEILWLFDNGFWFDKEPNTLVHAVDVGTTKLYNYMNFKKADDNEPNMFQENYLKLLLKIKKNI
jgi:hypothetical protein